MRSRMMMLAIVVAVLMPGFALANRDVPGGEYAYPKRVPYEDPPPTVVWGPFQMPDLRGLQWGLYGLSYQGLNDQLHANYFWQNRVRRYHSIDSTNPARPETIIHSYVPSPVTDSFQDLAYCRYDRSVWLHSSKLKRVYKMDAVTGAIKREFPSPATRYPVGIAFNERAKKLYLVDRMPEGTFPCSLYVTDTMGYVLNRFGLDHLGYSYSGARCLDFDYSNTNGNWPTLLLLYSYFSASGVLDSCALFELDPDNMAIIHRAKLPNLSGYVNNCRGVAWDPRNGDYWITIMQNPDNYIYKMDGWYSPLSPDVGIMSFVAPRGVYDSATAIIPQVVVRNFGVSTVDCPVRLTIGAGYNQVRTKTIRAGAEDTVDFPLWQPQVIGTYAARCSTALSGDLFAANDTWTEITQIVRAGLDVTCHRLMAPIGNVDSGAVVVPSCSTYNFGNSVVTYPVRMKVSNGYEQAVTVTGHKPGQFAVVTFPPWTASPRGLFAVSCSTELPGDTIPANDKKTATVRVGVRDAACWRILAPTGVVDSGAVIVPACSVYNVGTDTASYSVRMRVGAAYNQAAAVSNHPPGEYRYVAFPPWTAEPLGTHAVRCSTELAADMIPSNDLKIDSVIVRTLDVGATAILAPVGTLDSGTVVTPQAVVHNYGSRTETCPVTFRIGSVYDQTVTGITLTPGQYDTVDFPNWVAQPLGAHATLAFTYLVGDRNPSNDTVRSSVTVQLPPRHDVGATAILAPVGTLDSGTVVTPQAVVYNYGTRDEAFPVTFRIGSVYDQTLPGITLTPGQTDTLDFPDWVAQPVGVHTTMAFTFLGGDEHPENDTVTNQVEVLYPRRHDVGATAILAPVGQVDSGWVITPRAVVYNYGTRDEAFPVTFRIGSVYDQTVPGVTLTPGQTDTVDFPDWVAEPVGIHATMAFTLLSGDERPENDTVTGQVEVLYPERHDVGATVILAPVGTIDPGTVVTPEAVVYNYGTRDEAFPVTFRIGSVYDQTLSGITLTPGQTDTVDFPDWVAQPVGVYTTMAFTLLSGDERPENDTVTGQVEVLNPEQPDVGVTAILAPAGQIDTGQAVVPQSRVENFGNVSMSFDAWFMINDPTDAEVYRQSVTVTDLEVGADTILDFPEWPGSSVEGAHVASCSLAVADSDPENDTLSAEFTVVGEAWPPGWVEVAALPAGTAGRPVKDGAWLAVGPGRTAVAAVPVAGSQPSSPRPLDFSLVIYAARGNRSTDFYCHDPFAGDSGTWTALEPIPLDENGRSRPPRKGCVGISDGAGYVYMTKGNNTLGFWRYDIQANSWTRLPDVPAGQSGKNVKGGNDMVYVVVGDTGWVYLLKGGRNEFYRYNVTAARWDALEAAPFVVRAKYNPGSFLAYNGARTIYCHQARYNDNASHDMFAFDVQTGRWNSTVLPGMPLAGRHGGIVARKRSKDGGSGAWADGRLYALKGGNSQQFFRYDPQAKVWTELDTMPSSGSTGRRKLVKEGGDFVSFGAGAFFAFKGNKTFEFWRYVEGTRYASRLKPQARSGVQAGRSAVGSMQFAVSPNPIANGLATLRLSGPAAQRSSGRVRIFDAVGRCVLVRPLVIGDWSLGIPLDLRRLSGGVYLVRLDAEGYTATQKLVVQR